MSLLTDATSEQYDAIDFVLLYTAISTLSLIADHYLIGYSVTEWAVIFAVSFGLFLAKSRE